MNRKCSADFFVAALIAVAVAIIFGYRSGELGIYADDPGFLLTVHPRMSFTALWESAGAYVTGRNLHIFWQYLITVIVGGHSIQEIPAMHYVHVVVDTLNVVGLFFVLRIWGTHVSAAVFAAIAFAFFPNHGETHFWLSALPMNVLSASFVLALLGISPIWVRLVAAKNLEASLFTGLIFVIFFVCAMFTYDQAVPVAISIVTLLAIVMTCRFRHLVTFIALYWSICFSCFVGLLVWKVHAPAGGPVFRNLSLTHIYETFLQSIRGWARLGSDWTFELKHAGEYLLHAKYSSLESYLSSPHVVLATVTTIAVVVLIYVLLLKVPFRKGLELSSVVGGLYVKLSSAMVIGGILFFILAYLPAYLWYLSPRHSYLPSIGVAITLAGMANILIPRLKQFTFVKVGVLSLVGSIFFSFILKNLFEKEAWISAYRVRTTMYQEIAARYTSKNPTTILFAGFPSALQPRGPTLPFLTGEHAGAVSIITRDVIVATRIALHPVPSKIGYFIQTEEGRWGENALRHIAKKQSTVIVYEGTRDNRLAFHHDEVYSKFTYGEFYLLSSREPLNAGESNELLVEEASVGYDIQVPDISLSEGQRLALVACSLKAGKLQPLFQNTPTDSERFMIPVDVSDVRDAGSRSLNLQYRLPLPKADGFQLYIVDQVKALLVREVRVR